MINNHLLSEGNNSMVVEMSERRKLDNCQCEDIITLKTEFKNIKSLVSVLKQDITKQEIILANKDSIMGEIHSDNKKILEELKEMKDNIKGFEYIKNDYPNTKKIIDIHLRDHKDKDKLISNRNWAIWMILITTVISSIVGLIFNVLKS